MAQDQRNVNRENRWARYKAASLEKKVRMLEFCDGHPRVGWFIAFLSVVNVVLNLLELAH